MLIRDRQKNNQANSSSGIVGQPSNSIRGNLSKNNYKK